MVDMKTRDAKLVWIFQIGSFFLFFFLVSLILFSASVFLFNHDEDLYLLAARLSQNHTIYKQFLYMQPPLHALLLEQIFLLFGQYGYFFVAKLANLAFAIGCIGIFYFILRSIFETGISLALSLCLVVTPDFYMAAGVSRNDLMPLFFSLIAVYLILRPVKSGRVMHQLELVAAGLCITIAVGTKLNYSHMPLAALIFLSLWPPHLAASERLRQQLFPLSLGGLTGLALILTVASSRSLRILFRYL